MFGFKQLLLLSSFGLVHGFVEVGTYSKLNKSQSLNQSSTIHGWTTTGNPGLYTHDESLASSLFSDVKVAVGGVYFASMTLIFNSASDKTLKASIFINNDHNRKTGLTSFATNNSSVTVTGLAQLGQGDSLSVYVEFDNGPTWTVFSESTFFAQLLYSLTNYPAFQAVLPRDSSDVAASTWHRAEGWTISFEYRSGLSASIGSYCASCDGIYSIQGNILIESLKSLNGSVALFLANQTVISEEYFNGGKHKSVGVGGVFQLKNGEYIDVRTRSFVSPHKIIKSSGFSLFYLGAQQLHAESNRLVTHASVISTAGLYEISGWTADGSNIFFESLPTKMMNNGMNYTVETQGNYLISALVNFKSSTEKNSESIQLLILINKHTSSTPSDASIVAKKPVSLLTSLTINGVLFLSANDVITLCVYKDGGTPVIPLADSRFSVAMIPKDWPGLSTTLKSDQVLSTQGWNELGNWETGNLVNGLFSFDNAFNTVSGRYVVPFEGTYIISCVININGSAKLPLEVMIAVNGKLDTTSALYSRQNSGRGLMAVPLTGTIRLSRGQHLSVFVYVTSGTSWKVGQQSSFTVSLNGAGRVDSQGFTGVKTQVDDHTTTGWKEVTGWQPRDSTDQSQVAWDSNFTRFTPSEDGIYLITANVIVSHSALSEFHAMIVADGKFDKFSGGQSFQSVPDLPTSPWQFTLPVSSSLKLTTSQYVSIYVRSLVSVSYSIHGNSTLSIVLISTLMNPHRGGINAVAKFDTHYGKEFSMIKKWKLSTADDSSKIYGVYNEQMNFIKDYSILDEYIQIENSGLYFLEATVEVKAEVSIGPYALAMCDKKSSQITAIYTSKLSDGQTGSYFGITMYGVLYLTRGQRIFTCLSGPNEVFRIGRSGVYHIGFSVVRIVPRDYIPGMRQVADSLTSSSPDWIAVSDWTSGGMSSLYKRGAISTPGIEDMKISTGTFFISSSFLTTNTSSTVEICVSSLNCDSCFLQATSTNGGVSQAAVLRFQSQKNITTCKKRYSGTVSRSAQFLPRSTAKSTFYYRHDSLTLISNGEVPLTKWVSTDNQTQSDITVTVQGLYIVTINIVLKSTMDTRIRLTVYLNTNAGASTFVPGLHVPVTWTKANDPMALGLSSLVRIQKGNSLSVKVYSESNTASVQSGATFSAGLVTEEPSFQGMSVREPRDLTLSSTPNWMIVQGWELVSTGAVTTSSVVYQGRFVVETSGVYVVMATVSVSVKVPAGKKCTIELLLSIDDDVAHNNNLIMSRTIKGNDGVTTRTATLSLSSTVYLSKWQAVFPKLRSATEQKITILKESSFYIALIDQQRYYSHGCDNVGPRMVLHPQPFQRVPAGVCKKISLHCDVVADGRVTYKWFKNNQLLDEASPNMVIDNAQLSDAGRYMIVAEANNVSVTSYPAVVEVFDTRPMLSRSTFEVSVNETSSKLNLLLINFTALTVKENQANVSFIIESGNINDTFEFNPPLSTNEVTLTNTKTLDYEHIKKYQLIIKATNTDTLQSVYTHVTINVNDVNDNAPEFRPEAYSASVYENAWVGALVVQVTAIDMDSGDNSKVVYGIVGGNTGGVFGIHPDKGLLLVNNTLDFETNQSYNLTIEARDRDNPSLKSREHAHVIITVQDSNDNNPVFVDLKYNFTIAEVAGNGTFIGRVNATDADQDNYGRISFSILDTEMLKVFSIDKTSGVLSLVGRLDYESKKFYVLLISAQDQGAHPRSSTTLVYIWVQDANDNYPTCNPRHYNVTVTETTIVGTEIVHVYADDKDHGLNGDVSYSISGGNANGMFRVSSSGVIVLNKSLDRETASNYNLNITLTDKGSPPKVSHDPCRVIIQVMDVNDNYPQFLKSVYHATLPENTIIGYDVIRVNASDADSGANALLTYDIDQSCSSVEANQSFAINATTGDIYTTQAIDYDILIAKSLRLRVVVKDGGLPSLSSYIDVIVMVTDVNDNVPVFVNLPYALTIRDDTPEDKVIFTAIAKDADTGLNAQIRYSIFTVKTKPGISCSLDQDVFGINSTSGQLFPIKSFRKDCTTQYDVIILANDTGNPSLSSRGNLTVIVKDVNDRSPIFQEKVYEKTFIKLPLKGSLLESVKAMDADFGNNSVIDYEVSLVNATKKCPGEFTINSNGGIYNNENLEPGCKYSLLVVARDRGAPSRAGKCHVIISVKAKATEQNKSTGGLSTIEKTGLAAGIAILGIIILLLILLVIIYKYRQRKYSKDFITQDSKNLKTIGGCQDSEMELSRI